MSLDKKTKNKINDLRNMSFDFDLDTKKLMNDLGVFLKADMESWVQANIMNYVKIGGLHNKEEE
ncbi:hypothetical protein FC41_GL000065 [Lactobacillus hominis DSM 23910 = CRBIP 24.179]|uniref:Uncharacterized protein n=2 Tax=Lactobacillus hominis TaxID=1203033 RepID=I7IVJ9_9LACO|nr:hypothetical protein FC41_GL000065 [Lactobacillus hominis DSM 23910 = CRBIP 24.179]CCI81573.1 Protein of unknown function [Lactobacillus hominis DSM 23910 = CRBIP 24.179]